MHRMPLLFTLTLLCCSALLACAGDPVKHAPVYPEYDTAETSVDGGQGGGADTGSGATGDTGATSEDSSAASQDANGAIDAGTATLDAGGTGAVDAGNTAGAFDWGKHKCVTEGPKKGFEIGHRLGDVPVFDCDTAAPRSLDELCGAKATWLFAAHSHCPTCQATAKYTPALAQELAKKGVAVAHLVYIDDHQSCPSWRKKYGLEGIPNLKVYLDKSGAAFSKIKIKPYTAAHAIMGKDQIITYKNHGLTAAGVASKVNLALTLK